MLKSILKTATKVTILTGGHLWRRRKNIARAVGSALTAGVGFGGKSAQMAYDIGSSWYYRDRRIHLAENKLRQQSFNYSHLQHESEAMDVIMVGGISLTELLLGQPTIPTDLESAFQMAFPDIAKEMTFQQAVQQIGPGQLSDMQFAFSQAYPNVAENKSFIEAIRQSDQLQLSGFLAGVKGKLFEIKFVDHLNNGNLPSGYRAELAEKANQAGWDVAILDNNNSIVDTLQLKASDSLQYIHLALERYPQIDVVVPEETFAMMKMHGDAISQEILNSGISLETLESQLENFVNEIKNLDTSVDLADDFSLFDSASHNIDMGLPLLSLALIAASEFNLHKEQNIYQKSFSFGQRSAKAWASYLAGAFTASVFPSFWFLGIFASMGLRTLLSSSDNKRHIYRNLSKQISLNRKIINNLTKKISLGKQLRKKPYRYANVFRNFLHHPKRFGSALYKTQAALLRRNRKN